MGRLRELFRSRRWLFSWLNRSLGAVARPIAMNAAWLLGFFAQGFQFIPGLDIGMGKFLALSRIEQNDYDLLEGIDIQHLAFTLRRDNSLIALGQIFARFNIMLIFIHQAAAQAPTHAGDFSRG